MDYGLLTLTDSHSTAVPSGGVFRRGLVGIKTLSMTTQISPKSVILKTKKN